MVTMLRDIPTRWIQYPVDEVSLQVGIFLLNNLLRFKWIILELMTLQYKEPIQE